MLRTELDGLYFFDLSGDASPNDLGGLTAQEAADLLGCPRGTVLSRVHRGHRRLASVLELEEIHDEA